MTKKERNQRLIIAILLLLLHFFVHYLRISAVEKHWDTTFKFILGIIPSFYSVIGGTLLFNIFEKKKRELKMPLYIGIASLLYEVTGDFGRKTGFGSTIDTWDVLAILFGILLAYLIERYYFLRNRKTMPNNA